MPAAKSRTRGPGTTSRFNRALAGDLHALPTAVITPGTGTLVRLDGQMMTRRAFQKAQVQTSLLETAVTSYGAGWEGAWERRDLAFPYVGPRKL